MSTEVRSWPYSFPQSKDFPTSYQRGNVLGQLIVRDRYMNERLMYANSAYVGLATPGDVGSWQMESKVEMPLKNFISEVFCKIRSSIYY